MRHFGKLYIIVIISLLSGAPFCSAESAKDIFFKANRQYDDGNFKGAAGLYEQLVSQGVISGNIYYNLGNAYYKMGKKGKALLNYERASRLIPDNEDLFANISFIKSVLDAEQPEETHPLYQKLWMGIRDAVSMRTWFFICALVFFSACLILGMGFLSYNFRGRASIISGILAFIFLISSAFFIDSYKTGRHFKPGIIVTPEADVRYSPSYSGVVAFRLVEGMRAQIVGREGPWIHIRLNREKSGWIESEAIEAI